ncbi:MAG: SLOG family protein [Acidimicrobiales bacterium]
MTEAYRILVCGTRDGVPADLLDSELTALVPDVVITGGARGADAQAAAWAHARGVEVVTYEADWATHGPAAGPIRNQAMLDGTKPDLVLAFPSPTSVGTYDMLRRAKAAHVAIRIVNVPTSPAKPRTKSPSR